MTRLSQRNKEFIINIQTKSEYIWYLNAIFEGYDSLGVIRTIDKETGILEILSTKDQSKDIENLLNALSKELPLVIKD